MKKSSDFHKAEELLEFNEFESAIDLYKSAALLEEPNRTHLFNLSVAEEQARLQFHKELCKLYPNSVHCQSIYVGMLIEHSPGIALDYLTDLILNWKNDNEIIRFRFLRINASLRSRNPQMHVEDFTAILDFCKKAEGNQRLFYGLLKNIASINNIQSLSAFQDLIIIPNIPDEAVVLFELKIKELEFLIQISVRKPIR